jgi:hypothetical protein
MNQSGYREVWNLHMHCWSAFSDDVLSLEQAQSLLRQIMIPTMPAPRSESNPSAQGLGDAVLDVLAMVDTDGSIINTRKLAAAAERCRAALAQVPSAQGTAYTSERHFALREAHCIRAAEDFWNDRPGTKDDGRMIAFDAGFVRGFDAGTKLTEERTAQAPAAEPHEDAERVDALERLLQDGTLTIRTRHFLSAASRVQIAYGSEDPIGDSFGLRSAIDAALAAAKEQQP